MFNLTLCCVCDKMGRFGCKMKQSQRRHLYSSVHRGCIQRKTRCQPHYKGKGVERRRSLLLVEHIYICHFMEHMETPCLSCLSSHAIPGFYSHKMTMNLGSVEPKLIIVFSVSNLSFCKLPSCPSLSFLSALLKA
jgi:hypothetical protein